MKKIITICVAVAILLSLFAFSGCEKKDNTIQLFVSTDGNDENDGSKKSPFRTPERAVAELETLSEKGNNTSVEITLSAGEYLTNGVELSSYGFPVKMNGIGEVCLNSGVTIEAASFSDVTDEKVLARFSDEQKKSVKVFDLSSKGLASGSIGGLYAMGTWGNGSRYENGVGNNADLFADGNRLTYARWPDNDFVRIKEVIDAGDAYNYPSGVYHPETLSMENPRGGTITIDDSVMEHISGWAEPEKAWAFGYFYWDWADQSTPVKYINKDTSELTFSFVSTYGYKENQYFYFYNILEELDTANEFYIDRDEMKLYCFFDETNRDATFTLTVSDNNLLSGIASDIEFVNIQFKGVRGDIVVLEGDNITFRDCIFEESYGNAVSITGNYNLVYGCEVRHMGKGGIFLTGGNRDTLTPGNNMIENCDIHDFGELFRTYQTGANVNGVGNKIIHNEIYNTPHMALSFGGNDNLIAYNYIHNTSYEVDDGGALYVGRNWTTYGNVIEYNYFENIVGVDGHCPEAIYLDDSISGITVRNNVVKNCDGLGMLLGSGHDLDVQNNVLANCDIGISYDDRTCQGNWYDVSDKTAPGVDTLYNSIEVVPFFGEIWREKYPAINVITTDVSKYDLPEFIGNPSRSVVKNNFFISCKTPCRIDANVKKFSDIKDTDNFTVFSQDIMEDGISISGKYLYMHDVEGFTNPDLSIIGRYKDDAANKE